MSNRQGEINDDEIRIISSKSGSSDKGRHGNIRVILWILASILLIGILAIMFFLTGKTEEDALYKEISEESPIIKNDMTLESISAKAHVIRTDTIADGIGLTILTPQDATPTLEVGNDVLNDSTAVLIVQAADVRKDNGGIAGAYVVKGELLSKGEAKAGFCSIINGEVTVGVADATPMLEQALTSDGYFFRQYPLVVGGQIVENEPKGKYIRRALAEIDGNINVVISRDRLSFHDFSQALIDVGVRKAIYLVGGEAYGRYYDADGNVFTFGSPWDEKIDNVNYMVWR
ncbi:MAG: phosphodiester glycosidase family protein [Bacteroidales bacterium]|nr:phosphodiester glycosidase family protein [Bacteroidales bacterium]